MNPEERVNPMDELMGRAWSDEGFRSRLKADPKAVMAEAGVTVPEGVDVEVLENTKEVSYLVLPPLANAELADDELDAVTGGYPGEIWSTGSVVWYPGTIWKPASKTTTKPKTTELKTTESK